MHMTQERHIKDLDRGIVTDLAALLRRTVRDYAPVTLASSFSAEDVVLIDVIAREELDIEIFMLDTGRLHEETHGLVAETKRRYGVEIKTLFPDADALERFVGAQGPNAFFDSVALRHECCALRKVAPLRRALAGKGAWITGQRRQQSVTRTSMSTEEWDAANGLHKVNPLADWSTDDLWAYIARYDVPYNPLYDRGFTSIGCAPCTRAVTMGEDIRAGRWWWEDPDNRECGLHHNPTGPSKTREKVAVIAGEKARVD